jgi:hypothetical protein
MKSSLILRIPYNFYQLIARAIKLRIRSLCMQWSIIRYVKESRVALAELKPSL